MSKSTRRVLLTVIVLGLLLGGGARSLTPPAFRLAPTVQAQGTFAANVRLVAPYRVTVGTSAGQLTSSGNVRGVIIKAICPGQTIYIGTSSAVTTSTGYPLADGDSLTLEIRNASDIYAIASAAAQSVSVLPFGRY